MAAFRSEFLMTMHSQTGMGHRARKARSAGHFYVWAENAKPAPLLGASRQSTQSALFLYFFLTCAKGACAYTRTRAPHVWGKIQISHGQGGLPGRHQCLSWFQVF